MTERTFIILESMTVFVCCRALIVGIFSPYMPDMRIFLTTAQTLVPAYRMTVFVGRDGNACDQHINMIAYHFRPTSNNGYVRSYDSIFCKRDIARRIPTFKSIARTHGIVRHILPDCFARRHINFEHIIRGNLKEHYIFSRIVNIVALMMIVVCIIVRLFKGVRYFGPINFRPINFRPINTPSVGAARQSAATRTTVYYHHEKKTKQNDKNNTNDILKYLPYAALWL